MDDKDMTVLLLALCKLQKVRVDVIDVVVALRESWTALDLYEKGANPFGTKPLL